MKQHFGGQLAHGKMAAIGGTNSFKDKGFAIYPEAWFTISTYQLAVAIQRGMMTASFHLSNGP
jgi:hypothetical protein